MYIVAIVMCLVTIIEIEGIVIDAHYYVPKHKRSTWLHLF